MPGIPLSQMAALASAESFRPPPLDTHSLNPASWMYERLVKKIVEFEKDLDQTKEVGAKLANFGAQQSISIEDVGFWGPDLVIFYGKNSEGHPVELLQHVTQVNVLLVAVPTQADPPRRIGFILEGELERMKATEKKEDRNEE